MTGFNDAGASQSDKKVHLLNLRRTRGTKPPKNEQIGVVGLTLFDLRRLGKVDQLGMVGVNGKKFPAIRKHLEEKIAGVYKDMDIRFV